MHGLKGKYLAMGWCDAAYWKVELLLRPEAAHLEVTYPSYTITISECLQFNFFYYRIIFYLFIHLSIIYTAYPLQVAEEAGANPN